MQIVKKNFCTIFRRSEAEKRAWNVLKELDDQKEEISSLRAELEALKETTSKVEEKSEAPKSRTTKKGSSK